MFSDQYEGGYGGKGGKGGNTGEPVIEGGEVQIGCIQTMGTSVDGVMGGIGVAGGTIIGGITRGGAGDTGATGVGRLPPMGGNGGYGGKGGKGANI